MPMKFGLVGGWELIKKRRRDDTTEENGTKMYVELWNKRKNSSQRKLLINEIAGRGGMEQRMLSWIIKMELEGLETVTEYLITNNNYNNVCDKHLSIQPTTHEIDSASALQLKGPSPTVHAA